MFIPASVYLAIQTSNELLSSTYIQLCILLFSITIRRPGIEGPTKRADDNSFDLKLEALQLEPTRVNLVISSMSSEQLLPSVGGWRLALEESVGY